MSIRVFLADDHKVVRAGLKALLQSHDDVTLVGESTDGLETVERVAEVLPDVLVVDISMPGLDGLEVTTRVLQQSTGTRVVVLSMHVDEGYVEKALARGASAYVVKTADAPELLDAIQRVAAGGTYLSKPLDHLSVEDYLTRARADRGDPYERLSPREREVLQLVAEGNTSPEIAERFGISVRTVETHRANLLRKLNLKGQADLVRFAMRRGMLPEG